MASATGLLVIGWDSAPPDLVFERWRADLPTLSRIMDSGPYGPLRSTDPPITVPAWTSMLSSHNPGELGFYGFRNRRVGEYEGKWIATSRAVKVDRVWDILSREGLRSCVINVPQTFPLKPLNGAMISCFLTPGTDSEYTYPAALKEEVERVAEGYVIDCEGFRTEDKQALLEQIHVMTEKRFRVARHLLTEAGPWDLFMMVEMGPDRIAHGFWKYMDPQHRKYEAGNPFEDAIRDYYRVLDRQLGELWEAAGDEATVLVVSDHGAKGMEGSVNLNDWLLQEGLLALREPVDGVTRFEERNVDWSRTVAWGWGGYYGRLFVNLKGREPRGTVAPGEYESVREDIIRRLEALPDDTGRPMKTRVFRPQDVFTGSRVEEAPDLFVYFDDLRWRAAQDVGHGSLYSFDTEIGPDDSVHDYHGIFALARPGQRAGRRVEGLHCMDVAPTILRELGVDVPPEMEGTAVG